MAILEEAGQRVEEFLEGTPSGGSSKALGGNGGTGRSGGGGGGPAGKSYSDLPADAKAYCEKSAGRFVGPGKRYKDVDSWRKGYAKSYFTQE